MSKFIKRIGTKAYKFHVDIYLKKFEMAMLGNQQCKCLIIFKRGDHTIKCKNPVNLQNKEAIFSEVLSHISTLYYNKKKKKYLTKPAQLDIVLIFQDNQQKAAGTVLLDLSSYPNSGVKKASETLIVEKSPDKNAKITFEIKIFKLGEVEDIEHDTSFIQSNEPFKKSAKQPNKSKINSSKKPQDPNTSSSKELNHKNPPKDLKKDGIKDTNKDVKDGTKEVNKDHHKDNKKDPKKDQNKPKDIKKPPISSQNISKQSKAKEKSSSEEDDSNVSDSQKGSESEESGSDSESGSISGSGSGSGSGSEASESNKKKALKDLKLGIRKSLRKSKSQLEEGNKDNKGKTIDKKNPFQNNNQELNLSNIKSVKTINSDDHLSQKIKSLLKDSAYGSKDSTKIEYNQPVLNNMNNLNNIKKNEDIDKKITLPSNFNTKNQDDSGDDEHMLAEFSAQKIKQLELKLIAKNKENQENLRRIQELEEQNSQITDDMNKMKAELEESNLNQKKQNSFRTSVGTPTFESKMVEKEAELKALKLENLELKNTVKLKDLEIKEKNINFTRNYGSDNQILELKNLLETKEKQINELELEKEQSSELIEKLKTTNNGTNNNTKTNKISEDFYKKKLEGLNEEVFNLKKQLEETTSNEELTRLELENEVSKLKIENQNLSKQVKEFQNVNKSGAMSLKNYNKMSTMNNDTALTEEINELKQKLNSFKENNKVLEVEKIGLEEKIKEKEKDFLEITQRVSNLEEEVQKSKQKIADVLNVALETGGAELVELIENAVVDQKTYFNEYEISKMKSLLLKLNV